MSHLLTFSNYFISERTPDNHKDSVSSNGDANVMDDIVSEEMHAPSLSRKTLQSLLTVEEEEVFTAMFSSLIKSSKPINQNEVVKMIEKEPKLSDLSS